MHVLTTVDSKKLIDSLRTHILISAWLLLLLLLLVGLDDDAGMSCGNGVIG